MAHRTRSEQLAVKARKDPRKLAKSTKRHETKTGYKRTPLSLVDIEKEYEYEIEDVN